MKMKKLFLTLNLLGSLALAEDVFVQCVTEWPSTSFFVETVGDRTNLQVIHHNGLAYAPFWNSIIVPNDFTILKEKADLVSKLANEVSASWKKSNCRIVGPTQFVCMGATEKVLVNEIETEPWAVYSSLHKENSFAGEYEHVEVAYRFYVNGVANEFVMKFAKNECLVSANPIKKNK